MQQKGSCKGFAVEPLSECRDRSCKKLGGKGRKKE